MKKIFILTGEPSGDKLASKVIKKLKIIRKDVNFLSVGGENIKALGIKSIFELKEITYLGFTKVFLNLFKINSKINKSVSEIIKFNPDILFTVDSPDFTLRVAQKVKKKNVNIKTVHYVAPQVWVWREGRVKKLKKYIDHILLLFKFEKVYFDKEGVSSEFVGHPLLENSETGKIDINQFTSKNKAVFSIFAGSRESEINVHMPILLNFIKLMSSKYNDFIYIFHSTNEHFKLIQSYIQKSELSNCEVISDNKIKEYFLKKSIFAVSKSGTVSLEICKLKIPSIIIYKMNMVNFLIIKMLVKVNYANIINIASNEEIIPELLQSNCNAENIFKHVNDFLENPNKIKEQITKTEKILDNFVTQTSPSDLASLSLNKLLKC